MISNKPVEMPEGGIQYIPYADLSPGVSFMFIKGLSTSNVINCRETLLSSWWGYNRKGALALNARWAKSKYICVVQRDSKPDFYRYLEYWWDLLEEHLGIPDAQRSTFYKLGAGNGYGAAIRISEWWKKNILRSSMMSMFLRGLATCQMRDDDEIYDFLCRYSLVRNNERAKGTILRFLEGATVPSLEYANSLLSNRGFVHSPLTPKYTEHTKFEVHEQPDAKIQVSRQPAKRASRRG